MKSTKVIRLHDDHPAALREMLAWIYDCQAEGTRNTVSELVEALYYIDDVARQTDHVLWLMSLYVVADKYRVQSLKDLMEYWLPYFIAKSIRKPWDFVHLGELTRYLFSGRAAAAERYRPLVVEELAEQMAAHINVPQIVQLVGDVGPSLALVVARPLAENLMRGARFWYTNAAANDFRRQTDIRTDRVLFEYQPGQVLGSTGPVFVHAPVRYAYPPHNASGLYAFPPLDTKSVAPHL